LSISDNLLKFVLAEKSNFEVSTLSLTLENTKQNHENIFN